MTKSLITLVLIACIATVAPAAPLRVVSSVSWIDALVVEIGGERVERQTLVRPSEDPHSASARPSLITAVRRANLLVINGLDYEVSFLSPLLESSANPRVTPGRGGYLDLSDSITPLEVPSGKIDRSQGDIHPFGNPHYFSDPANLPVLATALAERLSRLDSANAPYYEARLQHFKQDWGSRMSHWTQKMADFRGRGILLYHRSHTYFLKAFGLSLAGTIEPVPGIPPSPRRVAELTTQLKERAGDVACILHEPWFEKRTAMRLSDISGVGIREFPEGELDGKAGALARWFDALTTRIVDCAAPSGKPAPTAP
jgi:zinc/manganese transport system substrate-binding protein